MTRKPLLDLIPDILKHIRKYEEVLQYNLRLYRVVEGQIRKEIEDSMREEILSPVALRRALKRVPSINILRKARDKLSKVYAQPVIRVSEKKPDQDLMNSIVKIAGLDAVMMSANKMWNLTKMAAIEPFSENGKQQFRVLAGHQFLPYSDDIVNPLNMTVFIKLLGKVHKADNDERPYIKEDGVLITEDSEIKQVDLFQLFSDKEIIIVDGDGSIRLDKMQELGLDGSNPLGEIPQMYLNKSDHELVPFPDTAGLDVSIVVPKLLADLNYAAQFMSHSLIWTKNADLGNQEAHPDSIVDLGNTGVDGAGDPEIGTIDPKVDIPGILSLVEFQMAGYFSSIGIKSASMKSMMPGREASGIAKAMDEGDTSAEMKVQIEFFRCVEHNLWDKITLLQKFWSDRNLVTENRKFTSTFADNLSIVFNEFKVMESSQEKTVRIQTQRDLGVIDRRSIIKEFNPDFSEKQIDERLAQIDKEKDESMKKMMEMGGGLGEAAEDSDQGTEELNSNSEGSSSGGNDQPNQE